MGTATPSRPKYDTPTKAVPAIGRFLNGNDRSIRFGDWLVRRGLISREDLFSGLSQAFAQSMRIGDAIVKMDLLDRGAVEEEATRYHTFNAFQYSSSLIAP